MPGRDGVDQLMFDDPTRPVNVQWPMLPAAPDVTAAIQTWVTGLGTEFLAENAPSETAPPELQGTWEFLRQGPGIVGVRVERYEFVGAHGVYFSKAFYGDTRSSASWTGEQLVQPGTSDAVADAVAAAVKASGRTPIDDALSAKTKAALLEDLSFDPSGNLRVRIAQGLLLAYSDGGVEASVPWPQAEPLLTSDAAAIRPAAANSRAPH